MTKSPRIAAGRAAEARAPAAGAQVWARAANAVAGEQDLLALLDVQDAAAAEAARERRRLSENLRARLGLPAPDRAAQKAPLRVESPFSAKLLAQFLIGFGFVLVLLGPALTLDKSLEVKTLTAAGISVGGLGMITLALLLVFGSRAVSTRRWSRRLDQLYGETEEPAAGRTVATT